MSDGVIEQEGFGEAHPGEGGAATAGRLLLVYQMAKVASMSWMALGQSHFAATDAAHIHYLAEDNRAYLHAQREATGPEQTIRRPFLMRQRWEINARTRALLPRAILQKRPILIVTGVRDPVARSVSWLFFMSDLWGHRQDRLSLRDGGQVEDLQKLFLEVWEQVFQAEEPADTFSRLLRFYFKAYSFWFQRELARMLGIDALGASFPAGPARRIITQGRTQTLIYRVEDMAPGSPGHTLLRADIEAIAGAHVPSFPVYNTGLSRRSGDLYRAFVQSLRVPAHMLDRIYGDPVVRYFYSDQEVDGFRGRWLRGPA